MDPVTPAILRDLRLRAQEIIRGRDAWEAERGPSAKPLAPVEVNPRDLIKVLDEVDRLALRVTNLQTQIDEHAAACTADPHADLGWDRKGTDP